MKVAVPTEILPVGDLGAVHFVGIGGAGLSAIARLMQQQGAKVSGSDQHDSLLLAELHAEGIETFASHQPQNVAGKDTVIVSTAVPEDNVEVRAAREAGARIWPRSAGLMAAMLHQERIAVAGTHGKTTTTAMLTLAMQAADVDVSFAIGAQVPSLGTNAKHGTADVMIVEADESDGAFLHYAPAAAVITNIDADHLDSWGSEAAYEAAFEQFADSVTGDLIVCADDPGCQRLLTRFRGRFLTVGFSNVAEIQGRDLQITAEDTRFWVELPDGQRAEVILTVAGAHYATDALLALVKAWRLGADLESIVRGLHSYTGASRRMEFKGEAAGITVTDSYAHHPTEIAADLAAARAIAGERRLVVVFQPHLVSRTRIFAERMGIELSAADLVVVTDIYVAREAADPAVTAELVAAAITDADVSVGGSISGLADRLAPRLQTGDFVLTLGAGDVTKVGPELLAVLAQRNDPDGA